MSYYIVTHFANIYSLLKILLNLQNPDRKGTGPQSEEAYGQTLLMDRPTAPQLSVGDVTFDSIEIVWSFPLESPNLTVALTTINGYYIYSKSHSSQWMDKQIRQKISSYTAIDLLCGTLYQVLYSIEFCTQIRDSIIIKLFKMNSNHIHKL